MSAVAEPEQNPHQVQDVVPAYSVTLTCSRSLMLEHEQNRTYGVYDNHSAS